MRLHVMPDILAYYYYSDVITLLINFIFLFHIAISIFVFSSKHIFKNLYTSNWVLYYFLSICLLCLFYYLSKFTVKLQTTSLLLVDNKNVALSFSNVFADTIVCLALITSMISWVYLSERYMYKTHFFIFYFFIFIVCTINMVSTPNLLLMFIFFEFIFLPSLFFVYQFGYSKKVDKTISYLLKWTFSGSFLVLLAIAYMYSICFTLNIHDLSMIKFSELEFTTLYVLLFFGFGVKIPIWPFYYWLTKVHVEAPAGFSIFLSGFLVKTAFFCLSVFFFLLKSKYVYIFSLTFVIWGVLDASIRMWTSPDIKKLVAFATVQEMNLIILLLLVLEPSKYLMLNLFLLVHGLLSSLFFYLVDQVQKQYLSRNLNSISGAIYFLPNLSLIIWSSLLVFRGFPIFVKFFIEWELLSMLLINYKIIGVVIFLVFSIFGVLGFFRVWMSIMYGQPQNLGISRDILKLDLIIGFFLLSSLCLLSFCLLYF